MTSRGSAIAPIASSAVVVVGHAVAQAAIVAVTPRVALDAGAISLAVVSGLAMLLAAGALWSLALRARSARLFATITVAAVLMMASAVAAPVATAVVAAVTSPVIAAGTLVAAWAGARRHPWRTGLGVVITAAAVVLAVIAATLLGLLAPGAPGAAAAWLIIGAGAAVLIRMWARWARLVAEPPAAAQP